MCQVPLFSSRAAGTSRVGFEAGAAPVKLRKAGMESDMSAPKQSPAGQCAQGPGKCSAVHCGGLPVQTAGARQVKLLQYSTPGRCLHPGRRLTTQVDDLHHQAAARFAACLVVALHFHAAAACGAAREG